MSIKFEVDHIFIKYLWELSDRSQHRKQWEFSKAKTWTTRMPAFGEYPPPHHDYHTTDWYQTQSQNKTKLKLQFFLNWLKILILEICKKNHYMPNVFGRCLIRCINMKWIQLVLWKIQSGHDSFHRWTYRRTDGQTTWKQYTQLLTLLKQGV